jgi:L-alanine-DL-glutamate epimerase-like enolase superfamily enzyme
MVLPSGQEKIHALGALDLALWDIKGKGLKLPVHQLLNGSVRNYLECYPTGGVGARRRSWRAHEFEGSRRGYDRGIGMDGNVFDVHQRVRAVARACKEVREGVGERTIGASISIRNSIFPTHCVLCRSIEDYEPYLVEDPTRDEQSLTFRSCER